MDKTIVNLIQDGNLIDAHELINKSLYVRAGNLLEEKKKQIVKKTWFKTKKKELISEAKLYHGTPAENVPAIKQNGLAPLVGANKVASEKAPKPEVHFTTDKKLAKEYAGKDGKVISVDSKDVKNLKKDPNEKKSVKTSEPVKPGALKIHESADGNAKGILDASIRKSFCEKLKKLKKVVE